MNEADPFKLLGGVSCFRTADSADKNALRSPVTKHGAVGGRSDAVKVRWKYVGSVLARVVVFDRVGTVQIERLCVLCVCAKQNYNTFHYTVTTEAKHATTKKKKKKKKNNHPPKTLPQSLPYRVGIHADKHLGLDSGVDLVGVEAGGQHIQDLVGVVRK